MGSISAANAEFCFDVFKELKVHHANDNIFYSPLSIISALAMVYLGARGNTQSQMEKVLHFDNVTGVGDTTDPQCGISEYIQKSFKDLLSGITMPNATHSLNIADRIYIEKTYPVLPEYLECANKFYGAGLEEVDFKTATEEARQLINSWQTRGEWRHSSSSKATCLKIESCPLCICLLKEKIAPQSRRLTFLSLQQESRPVQMMSQNSTFKVAAVAAEKVKILELPYAGGELSMLVLLPDDISGLEQLENKISFDKLIEWTSPNVMERKRVKVYLPRMKIEEKYNLTSVLTALGMTDLFSPSANLSGISSAESLKVSEAVHEAYMEVSEEGTETAGSEGVLGDIEQSSEFEEFRADHPFLFLIKHNPTNIILFFGKYYSP
uniref:Serpin domain-containing protein n=1 Tax=Falco tinnunculus TaxID=100819 RepID=A0A8C4XLL8_FALTI